jgi:hypothetical protein
MPVEIIYWGSHYVIGPTLFRKIGNLFWLIEKGIFGESESGLQAG